MTASLCHLGNRRPPLTIISKVMTLFYWPTLLQLGSYSVVGKIEDRKQANVCWLANLLAEELLPLLANVGDPYSYTCHSPLQAHPLSLQCCSSLSINVQSGTKLLQSSIFVSYWQSMTRTSTFAVSLIEDTSSRTHVELMSSRRSSTHGCVRSFNIHQMTVHHVTDQQPRINRKARVESPRRLVR